MNVPGWLEQKNRRNVAKWQWRWHAQGGSRFWIARDLQDLRTDKERQVWRKLEFKLWRTRKSKRNVVSLASVRIARAKRKRA
jgi:hypothetical protein